MLLLLANEPYIYILWRLYDGNRMYVNKLSKTYILLRLVV